METKASVTIYFDRELDEDEIHEELLSLGLMEFQIWKVETLENDN